MKRLRHGFTMLELVFVIVILGIIGVIGAKALRTMYDTYNASHVNSRLHMETELALEQIANRLQYRFKDSVIVRPNVGGAFVGLSFAPAGNYTIVEWVGYDIDGWLGDWNNTANFHAPAWSGFIDLDAGDPDGDGIINNTNLIRSPGTDTVVAGNIITDIRPQGSGTVFNSTAIFFTGANTDVQNGYGWGGAVATQWNVAAHPVNTDPLTSNSFTSGLGPVDFAATDIYEQYKLAWTAYGLELNNRDLILHYDYQPWNGGSALQSAQQVLAQNVDTFKVQAVGDIIKVQLCIDNNTSNTIPANQIYAICKEKVVF